MSRHSAFRNAFLLPVTTLALSGLVGCRTVGTSAVQDAGAQQAAQVGGAGTQPSATAVYEQTLKNWMTAVNYTPGSVADDRISACWKNPKASDLSDLQKLVYCYTPLEFRLCNTFVLLASNSPTDSHKKLRVKGYEACMKSSEQQAVLDNNESRQTYQDLFVNEGAMLSADQKQDLLTRYKPELDTREFMVLYKSSFYSLGGQWGDGTKGAFKHLKKLISPVPELIAKNSWSNMRDTMKTLDLFEYFRDAF